jgi:two-component system sensor histidine kinase SenX3
VDDVTVFLTLVGMVVAFGIGWNAAKSRFEHDDESGSSSTVSAGVSVSDILERHPIGVVIADSHGRIEFRNLAARKLSGTHSGVLVDEALERQLTLARTGVASEKVVELYGPPKVVFDVSSRPLPNGGSVAFLADISERRRVDQVRTDFVANISHELKTPVGALSVLAETLVDETDLETVQRIALRMMAETDRASRTIDDLMELSRIEVGAERAVETIKVADILRGAVDRVTQLASQREITINALASVDGVQPDDAPLTVIGDRRQIISAVGNLVENAVKYSEPGSAVQVRVRRNDEWIEIVVSDQGIGIPQSDLGRVFERFYRVDRARSRTTGGTGLGLSIVRHVASSHGGDVVVTSTEGEGSTFVLRLPIDRAEREGLATADTPSSSRSEGVA